MMYVVVLGLLFGKGMIRFLVFGKVRVRFLTCMSEIDSVLV